MNAPMTPTPGEDAIREQVRRLLATADGFGLDGLEPRDYQKHASAVLDMIRPLVFALGQYQALELGTPEGRISAKCDDSSHPMWLRDLDDMRGCPWCRVAEADRLRAENDRLGNGLVGANLALWEDGREIDRLRLALKAAQRGRRELWARVTELEAASPWERAVAGLNALVDADVVFHVEPDGHISAPFSDEHIEWDRKARRWVLTHDEDEGLPPLPTEAAERAAVDRSITDQFPATAADKWNAASTQEANDTLAELRTPEHGLITAVRSAREGDKKWVVRWRENGKPRQHTAYTSADARGWRTYLIRIAHDQQGGVR